MGVVKILKLIGIQKHLFVQLEVIYYGSQATLMSRNAILRNDIHALLSQANGWSVRVDPRIKQDLVQFFGQLHVSLKFCF